MGRARSGVCDATLYEQKARVRFRHGKRIGALRRAPGTGSVYQPTFRDRQKKLKKGRLYWIAYRVGEELRREPAHTANRRDAETLLRVRLSGLDRGELPATSRTTWEDLARMLRADYRANGRRSAARLELSLKHLGETFAGQRATAITSERVTGYAARRLEEGAARATVNRELAALKRGFRLAHRAHRVPVVPHVALLEERNARTGFFERPDFGRLLRALPRDLRPPVLAAYLTGWRLTSELLTRQWRHVDLVHGWMRLEPGDTKNGRGRQFPLFRELRLAILAQRRATSQTERRLGRVIPWLFHREGVPLFYRGKRGLLPSAYLRDAWLAACNSAGIPGRLRHDFRRSAVRNLLRAGVPLPTVMSAVGWETEAMLRRYAVVDEEMLREAGAKLARLRP